jgi:hypothetical protein
MNIQSPGLLEKKDLEKRYAKLQAQYESLSIQIEGELNADNLCTLETRQCAIKKELESTWDKLEVLEKSSDDAPRQYLNFKEDLPKIDFEEVMMEINGLIKSFKQERGDALLLLQGRLPMAGDLCLQRIRDEFKAKTGDFKDYKLEFYAGGDLNEYGWLHTLSGYFGLVVEDSRPKDLATLVIQKICQSVRAGSTIFLEIRKWDDLPCQEKTLAWFMQNFWIPLVQCLDDRTTYQRVKFIAVLVVDEELSSDCFIGSCLDEGPVVPFRWLKLPLCYWTQDEIQEWLESYPGVGNPHSLTLAKRFFKSSMGGMPRLVCDALEDELLLNET